MQRLPLDFIEKRMDEIRREYDADPAKYLPVPSALLKFLALADTIKAGCYDTFPKPLILADADRMALETLSLTGEVVIKEDSPPSPSVGWPGSYDITGQITGSFEVPASVVIARIVGNPYLQINECDYEIEYYMTETPEIRDKIEGYCIYNVVPDVPVFIYKPEPKFTGIVPKGDRTEIQFEIVIKENV